MPEFAHFPLGFSLLPALFLTRFFVVLTALQFTLDAIHLQLFLQLTNGIFNITSYFNFYYFVATWY